jgi:hypothetical protein
MNYWPPFWVHGVHRMEPPGVQQYCNQYKQLLTALRDDFFSEEEIRSHALMNELFPFTLNKENGT